MSFDNSKLASVKTLYNKTIWLAIGSAGMIPYKHGQSIQAKWHANRGFVKLHIIVDESDSTVLSAKLIDDSTGSGYTLQLEELLDHVLEKAGLQHTDGTECTTQNSDTRQQHPQIELRGDSRYDSRNNVAACKERNVVLLLRLVVTSTIATRQSSVGSSKAICTDM